MKDYWHPVGLLRVLSQHVLVIGSVGMCVARGQLDPYGEVNFCPLPYVIMHLVPLGTHC